MCVFLFLVKYNLGEEKVEIEYIPQVPKSILLWCLNNLAKNNSTSYHEALKRRVSIITSNYGVPIDILEFIGNADFNPNQFQRINLPLNKRDLFKDQILSNAVTKDALNCAVHHLNSKTSEATLRVRIWDGLLKSMVYNVDRFESEVDLKNFLKLSSNCKIDLGLITLNLGIPLLIIEISKNPPIPGHFHKDMIKMSIMMSRLCMFLAGELEKRGTDPLQARIFGILAGGTEFQLCVAAPEIRKHEKFDRDEIFINISTNKHWRMDLLKPLNNDICLEPCCFISDDETETEIVNLKTRIQNPTHPFHSDFEIYPNNFKILIDKAEDEKDEDVVNLAENYNLESVCKLRLFVECANRYIDAIDPILFNTAPRSTQGNLIFLKSNLSPKNVTSNIPQSKSSDSHNTPVKKILRSVDSSGQTQYAPFLENKWGTRKISFLAGASHEIDVYNGIPDGFKLFFPHLYEYRVNPINSKEHIFVFEEMEPLIIGQDFSHVIRKSSARELILDSATFAVHTLFGLMILHEKVGYVHSDISSTNIMFSQRLNLWKLNDFDHSFPIKESLKTVRRAGTSDYVAPESLETGIFTPESDVYSLGRLLFFCFSCSISSLINENGEATKEVDRQAFQEFKQLERSMRQNCPSERIKVREALKGFMDLIFKYEIPEFDIYGYYSILPTALLELEKGQEQQEIPFHKIELSSSMQ